jgi:tRNA A64-2'-O-ribosylphosphate transferase
MIVDSTRKGKTFPDSMSRTIPIWACVINRTCYRLRLLRRVDAEGPSAIEDEQQRWDRLCMPPWVGESERAQIERKLERFVEQLLAR